MRHFARHRKSFRPRAAALLTALLLTSAASKACPKIDGLIDFNCDQTLKIVVTGDSVVKGVGDTVHKNDGGYVLRLGKQFKDLTFVNLGMPGYTTSRLFTRLKMRLNQKRDNSIKAAFKDADIVLIDIGRNDYYDQRDPAATVKNIERIVEVIRSTGDGTSSNPPLVAISTLTPTTRGFQRPFIDAVNQLLLEQTSTDILPVEIRFDMLPPTIIGGDGLHPTSKGYTAMEKIVAAYLKGDAQSALADLRPDSDHDGVFDYYERHKFHTDPDKADTDGDGLKDGEELFKYYTDPLVADTDGDGISDGDEVAAGRNPLDPAS